MTTDKNNELPVLSAGAAARAVARRMTALCIGASLVSLLFVLSYGYALHDPQPHHLRIDVVAPTSSSVAAVTRGLEVAHPRGFDVRRAPDEAQARHDVRDDRAHGAVVEHRTGPTDVLVASAGGVSIRQLIITAATAQAQGRPLRILDLRPLPAGDSSGQSSFVFEIGLLIPGVIGSVGFYLLGRRVRLWVRVAAAVGYALLSSAAGVLVLDTFLGALSGSPWTLLATGTLAAGAFVLTVAALHAVFGLPGTGVAAGVLLVVGNAANGSTVPVALLPDGYRQLAPWLPNGAAVRAFRADVYFDGHGQGQPMLALALWVLVALAVIGFADLLHVRRRRLHPADHAQIHATSMVAQARSRTAAGARPVTRSAWPADSHPASPRHSCR